MHLFQAPLDTCLDSLRNNGHIIVGRMSEECFELVWATAEGEGQNVSREFGGEKRTAERALQNHFWRPQKLALVWSVPLSFKRNDRESPKRRGERIVGGGGGVQRRFCGMFLPPPPGVFHPLGCSLIGWQLTQSQFAA